MNKSEAEAPTPTPFPVCSECGKRVTVDWEVHQEECGAAEAPKPDPYEIPDNPGEAYCRGLDDARAAVKHIMETNGYEAAGKYLGVAESRPSAEEVQRLAQRWVWENAAITITPERLAAFYQWMQERIAR